MSRSGDPGRIPAVRATPGSLPVLKLRSGQTLPLVAGRAARVGRAAVDVCFVFDTTGSMSNKIDGLVRCTVDLVAALDAAGLDWRVTTVPFGDLTVIGDTIVTDLPFVADSDAAEAQLRGMPRFSGGGNEGESSIEAMERAIARRYREDAVKVLVLLTDEPALESQQTRTTLVDRSLRAAEVVCFVASPDLPYYRSWAVENGGTWFPISASMDLSAIVDLLRALVRRVASVSGAVHALGGGSVRRYIELNRGAGGP
jgi:hypothetical protein